MRKLKNALALSLAVLLTAAGAALPAVAVRLRDASNTGKVQKREIQTLELHMEDAQQLSMLAKLELMKQALYYIPQDKAAMTQEQILESVYKELAPYYDCGLMVDSWENAERSVIPYVVYGTGEQYFILWEVAFYLEADGYRHLNLYVDDQTGKILRLDYQNDSVEWIEEERYLFLEQFAGCYFSALGIAPSASEEENSQTAGTPTAAFARYTCGDMQHGKVTLEFYVYPHGCYVYFPL